MEMVVAFKRGALLRHSSTPPPPIPTTTTHSNTAAVATTMSPPIQKLTDDYRMVLDSISKKDGVVVIEFVPEKGLWKATMRMESICIKYKSNPIYSTNIYGDSVTALPKNDSLHVVMTKRIPSRISFKLTKDGTAVETVLLSVNEIDYLKLIDGSTQEQH